MKMYSGSGEMREQSVKLAFTFFSFYLLHMNPSVCDTSGPCRHLHTALECRCRAHQRLCTRKVQFPEEKKKKTAHEFSPFQMQTSCHTHSMELIPDSTTVIRTRRMRKWVGFYSRVHKHVWRLLSDSEM